MWYMLPCSPAQRAMDFLRAAAASIASGAKMEACGEAWHVLIESRQAEEIRKPRRGLEVKEGAGDGA